MVAEWRGCNKRTNVEVLDSQEHFELLLFLLLKEERNKETFSQHCSNGGTLFIACKALQSMHLYPT